jgi:thiol-disulfide isomerase/thioredoxin
MRASTANVTVISLVGVCIILLFVLIVLGAIYAPKAAAQCDNNDNGGKTARVAARRNAVPAVSAAVRATAAKAAKANAAKAATGGKTAVVTLKEEQDVRDLLANDAPPAMVMIYADWCGYCKKMHGVLDAVASDTPVVVAKINANDANALLTDFQVAGYPVLLTNFGDTKYVGYRDAPSVRTILRSANANSKPKPSPRTSKQRMYKQVMPMQELTDETMVTTLLEQDGTPVLVMVYAEWCGYCKKMRRVLDALAQYAVQRGVQLYNINYKQAPALCQRHQIKGFPAMLSNFGSRRYNGYMEEPAMRAVLDSAGM